MFCEDAVRGSHGQVGSKAEMDSSHGEVDLENHKCCWKKKKKINLLCRPRAVRVVEFVLYSVVVVFFSLLCALLILT